jgi:tetratricopeptide (TPR) repeat protein
MDRILRLVVTFLLAVMLLGLSSIISHAEIQPFPFTEEEDVDGARYVWFIYGATGFYPYRYVPAKFLPDSGSFSPVLDDKLQAADVVWWDRFVALYKGKNAPEDANLITGHGETSLKELQTKYGPVKWYRFLKPTPLIEPSKETLDNLDNSLSALRPILDSFPPAIYSNADLTQIHSDWERMEKEFVTLISTYPRSAELELRLGELYRFGHNIDVSKAWRKSESHYNRALDLSPWLISGYIGLGMLYVNTDFNYAAKAELLFKEAIKVGYGKEIPANVYSGLFSSYYFQGRMPEAIEAADKYLELQPDDDKIRRLRNIAKENVQQSGAPDSQ